MDNREAFESKNYIDPAFEYHEKLNLYVFKGESAPQVNGGLVRLNEDWGVWQIAWQAALAQQGEQEPTKHKVFMESVENWRHDSEELEALHRCLDDMNVPRDENEAELSAWGRVLRFNRPQPATIPKERMRELFFRYHKERYNPASEHYRFEHFYNELLAATPEQSEGE